MLGVGVQKEVVIGILEEVVLEARDGGAAQGMGCLLKVLTKMVVLRSWRQMVESLM